MSTPATSSQLPHNIEAEQGLLGALLVANEALGYVIPTGLDGEHFFEPLHAALFREIKRQIEAGLKVTPITLKSSFPEIEVAGMPLAQYLARLAAESTTIINAPDYANFIKSLALIRQMIELGQRLETAKDLSYAPDVALAHAVETFDAIRLSLPGMAVRNAAGSIEQAATKVVDRMAQIAQGHVQPAGVLTGIHDIDANLAGFKGGELVIMAGRPGMGKTTVGGSFARQMATGFVHPKTGEDMAGRGVGYFSLEMPELHMGARLLADQAYDPQGRCTCRDHHLPRHRDDCPRHIISYQSILSQENSDARLERVALAARALMGLPLEFDYSTTLSVGEIAAKTRAMARKMKREHNKPLEVLFIDYLKFVKASDRYMGQRHYEIGEISAALKILARDLNLCVILLAQLNRKVEERANKRPELSDLRESGDLEADADVVLLLYREAYYLQTQVDRDSEAEVSAKLMACHDRIEFIIAKQRMGPTTTLPAFCETRTSSIRNLDRADQLPTEMG